MERQLRCFRFNMPTAEYACLAPGGMAHEEHEERSAWLQAEWRTKSGQLGGGMAHEERSAWLQAEWRTKSGQLGSRRNGARRAVSLAPGGMAHEERSASS